MKTGSVYKRLKAFPVFMWLDDLGISEGQKSVSYIKIEEKIRGRNSEILILLKGLKCW